MKQERCALIMAGGTGGHIFPGLALAHALRQAGWRVAWLGTTQSMESRLVPQQGFALHTIAFEGIKGRGVGALMRLPWRMMQALWQTRAIYNKVRPDVVIGLGGYVTVPGGLWAGLSRKPLLLHEQNAVMGLANRVLARWAQRVLTAFPMSEPKTHWIGNPLRQAFLMQPPPEQRWQQRSGRLRVVVLGGSLGATALNQTVPQALARMKPHQRPEIVHQSGEKHLKDLQKAYDQAGVSGKLVAFVDDVASLLAQADLVISRAGASTVTEIAAVGVPALLIPFPYATDDHQTQNAAWLVKADAAWCQPQDKWTAAGLADFLTHLSREQLLVKAQAARAVAKVDATEALVQACIQLWLNK